MTIELLDAVRSNLERSCLGIEDFVAEVRKHAKNEWRNPAGFLRDLSKRFRAKTRVVAAPVTAEEAERRNYKCPICFSTVPGEGAIPKDNEAVPCSCASPEYIARMRDLGVFAKEPG